MSETSLRVEGTGTAKASVPRAKPPLASPSPPPPVRTEQDLADFVDNAAVGLQWLDASGTILWANRAEMDLLGYSPENTSVDPSATSTQIHWPSTTCFLV